MSATVEAPMAIHEFRPVRRGASSLIGFACVEFGDGLRIFDLAVHKTRAHAWVLMPGRAVLEAGELLRDADGGPLFERIVNFRSKEDRLDFSSRVIRLLRASYPEAFR